MTLNNAIQSDTYTLGVILYKLLTCEYPHGTGGSKWDVIQRIANTPIRPPREADPKMPRELAAILEKALKQEPKGRYESSAELAHDLRDYLDGNPVAVWKKTPLYKMRKRIWKHRIGLTVTAAILAVVTSVGVLSYLDVVRARNAAELQRAEVMVSKGDVLADAGKWDLARESYGQAHDLFVQERGATTTADIGIWNTYRHAPPALCVIHGAGDVLNVALTPDGCRAVTVSQDGRLCLWDALTGGRIGDAIQVDSQMTLCACIAAAADRALTGSAGLDGETC